MSRTLFLSVSPGEIWAALAEDDELVGLRLLRTGAPSRVGEIYLGRIAALRPELPAALVDLGFDRPAFLDARDADRRTGITGLTEGQAVIVEIVKEARDDKAAGVRVLRANERRRPNLEILASKVKAPARLAQPEPPIAAVIMQFLDPLPARIVIDDRAAFAEARGFLARRNPDAVIELVVHAEPTPVFEAAGVQVDIDTALASLVALPGGGTLHIETTYAATVIDVDSGKDSGLAANLEAAQQVARQILLRNIAGPVVIDFVGIEKRSDREAVQAALKTALASDPEKADVLGWTRLGHMELVRKRRHAPLGDILYERAPDGTRRKSAITLALEALRAVAREAAAQPGRALLLVVHPEIAAALDDGEGEAARRMLETRLGRSLVIEARASGAREAFDIRPA